MTDERFGTLLESCRGLVRALVNRRMIARDWDHDAIVQDVLVRAWVAREQFLGSDHDALCAWITKVGHNICTDAYKSRGRRPRVLANTEVVEYERDRVPCGDPGPEELTLSSSGLEAVIRRTDILCDTQYAVLVRFAVGMNYDEIAADIGTPVGTVRSSLHRGRVRMRKVL